MLGGGVQSNMLPCVPHGEGGGSSGVVERDAKC